ncbi:hypothetical protein NCS57_01250500 [Fusarium keratoplasticum]|uniref:Uncharacterized protein n=1 Tax=Fusarium keratoplasticum TaxID=1328300 RepID=A0ACC0QIG1_9HYPO|nr:hypothetical protein NCS57_01250500 [Fusarium keratoplasticum]KAI8655029.1 hypothetical protein NCS57_01250500 [Fusarium keratoplasticum]
MRRRQPFSFAFPPIYHVRQERPFCSRYICLLLFGIGLNMESRLWPIRRALQGVSPVWKNAPSGLLRRDTAPAVCFDDCDGAYKVALSIGKSDKLCASGGSFMGLYQACRSCIEENSEGSSQDINSYLEPKFAQFVAYCEGGDADASGGIGDGTTACDECITTALEDYRGSTVMIVLGTKTVPTSSLLDKSVFRYVTVKQTVTYHETGQASSTATSGTDRNEPDSPPGPDIATIVGPVAPSVVLLIVLIFLGFRWYKKRERIKDQEAQIEPDEEPKVEKAQLHSDCISRPTYELEGSTPFIPDPIPPDGAEMAANEVAAHEMPTDKKLGERRAEGGEDQVKTEESKGAESKPDERNVGNGGNDTAGASK